MVLTTRLLTVGIRDIVMMASVMRMIPTNRMIVKVMVSVVMMPTISVVIAL